MLARELPPQVLDANLQRPAARGAFLMVISLPAHHVGISVYRTPVNRSTGDQDRRCDSGIQQALPRKIELLNEGLAQPASLPAK
jgi:hypothetical protein